MNVVIPATARRALQKNLPFLPRPQKLHRRLTLAQRKVERENASRTKHGARQRVTARAVSLACGPHLTRRFIDDPHHLPLHIRRQRRSHLQPA